jgi:hypothetical protein
MSPDLHALLQAAAPQPSRDADPREIERRARRVSVARRTTALAATAIVALGSVAVVRSAATPETRDATGERERPLPGEDSRVPGEDAEIVAYEEVPVELSAKAAVFVASVVGRAGLLDEFGMRWSYRAIEEVDGDFVARFEATRCAPPPYPGDRPRCDRRYEPARVRVAIQDDLFVVTRVEGPMTDRQQSAILRGEEETPADRRGWRLVAQDFARGRTERSWGVTFSLVWTANIPTPRGYGSTCWLSVYSRKGLIMRGPDLEFRAPDTESERVSMVSTEVETGMTPHYLGVGCDPPVRQRE